jgi:hypothetical protein
LDLKLRPAAFDTVSTLAAAGGVESQRYFTWRTSREDAPSGGVLGLKAVATLIGATWRKSPLWEQGEYCFMDHVDYPTLPALTAAYLTGVADYLCGAR